jgi:hypothetical protein
MAPLALFWGYSEAFLPKNSIAFMLKAGKLYRFRVGA